MRLKRKSLGALTRLQAPVSACSTSLFYIHLFTCMYIYIYIYLNQDLLLDAPSTLFNIKKSEGMLIESSWGSTRHTQLLPSINEGLPPFLSTPQNLRWNIFPKCLTLDFNGNVQYLGASGFYTISFLWVVLHTPVLRNIY